MSTPSEQEVNALADGLYPSHRASECIKRGCHQCAGTRAKAAVILASDWLADRDAALIAKAKAEGAVEALREHEAMRLARVDAHVAEIQNEALAPVLALVAQLDADLSAAAPAQFSIGLMRGRLKAIREAVSNS